MRGLVAVLAASALVAGCGGREEPAPVEASTAPGFQFAESGVAPGQPIDSRYTCDGDDVSPALAWQGAPDGTRELALVLEDPDAPGGTFTHWIVYAIPSDATSLPEAVPVDGAVEGPTPLRQGENDSGDIGYRGPCPPGGESHRYAFQLLALDAELGLEPAASRSDFDEAIAGHVVAQATLEATYERS